MFAIVDGNKIIIINNHYLVKKYPVTYNWYICTLYRTKYIDNIFSIRGTKK